MPIKIHHGAPGSYKTSGAMSDDILPIINSGRLIINNVRGFTRERVLDNFPDFDDDKVNIMHIDTDEPKNRELMSKWFHWAPLGAFFVIDEAQMIFPKKWDKKFIADLDYEGGEDKAYKDGRPHDWSTAWEKHRHYNWDFILTTPNIKLIRTDIRECSDGGFFHRDLASIGFKGAYKEYFHQAITGHTGANVISYTTKRINKDVFKLYKSTATDEFLYSNAGIKLWKDPKLLFASLFLLLAIFYTYNHFIHSSFFNSGNQVVLDKTAENIKMSSSFSDKKVPKNDRNSRKVRRENRNNDRRNVGSRNGAKTDADINIFDKEGKLNRRIVNTDFKPKFPEFPGSAPIYSDLWQPVTFPKLSCIASQKKCICHTQQSTRYEIRDDICRQYASIGYFDFTKPDTNNNVTKNSATNIKTDLSKGTPLTPKHNKMLEDRIAFASLKDHSIASRFKEK